MVVSENKRVMHIDTSVRFFQRGATGIAFKIVGTGEHKGVVFMSKRKKELKLLFDLKNNYEKLYAICIYHLIKDSFDLFDTLVICNDEKYLKVRGWLDFFFEGNCDYGGKEIISISYLRKITGDKKIRSYADKVANIYRVKGVKSGVRRQRGVGLNMIDLDFNIILDMLKKEK
ncbi:MAG: hypothetical protein PF542_01215 [Nanoarchaeota archaeon]|jgi:hypothetical protein|nr:hypothetical protein [Nanoarchaeota archaeon]